MDVYEFTVVSQFVRMAYAQEFAKEEATKARKTR